MRFLLDTHVLLWSLEDDPKLSPRARELLEDMEHQPVLSIASLWEMAIKISLGRLERRHSFTDLVEEKVVGQGLELIQISPAHLDTLTELPFHHRDPFDRLIVAQCLAEDLPLLSGDGVLDEYRVERLW